MYSHHLHQSLMEMHTHRRAHSPKQTWRNKITRATGDLVPPSLELSSLGYIAYVTLHRNYSQFFSIHVLDDCKYLRSNRPK